MQKVILALLALVVSGWGAISSLTIPHEIDSAAIPKVIYIDQNNDSLVNKVNEIKDTVNLYLPGSGGFTGTFWSSITSLRATLDSDANSTAESFYITRNGSTDTIFKVPESLATSSRFWGHLAIDSNLTVRKVSAADSVVGAHLKTAGNLAFTSSGSAADWSLWRSAGAGLVMRGGAGSSYDLSLMTPAATYLIRNPTGTQSLEFPGTGTNAFTGRVNVGGATDNSSFALNVAGGSVAVNGTQSIGAYGVGNPGDANYERITMVHTGSAAELRSQAGGSGTVEPLRLVVGSTTRYDITNAGVHTVTGDMDVSATLDVAGAATAATIALGGNEAHDYDEGTFTITMTGVSGTVTGTARYTRVGKAVTLYLPTLQGTSNATSFTLTGMPAAIRPAVAQNCPIFTVQDNTTNYYTGSFDIATSGTITVYKKTTISTEDTIYTSSGTKGIAYCTVHYTIQ